MEVFMVATIKSRNVDAKYEKSNFLIEVYIRHNEEEWGGYLDLASLEKDGKIDVKKFDEWGSGIIGSARRSLQDKGIVTEYK